VIRALIRGILLEDLQGFKDRTRGITYGEDGYFGKNDTTFDDDPSTRALARSIKSAWAAEADHDFMDRVIKVHWIKKPSLESVANLIDSNGKDEISCMGYLRGPYETEWGNIGLRIDGRTTLAANNMDALYSGYMRSVSPSTIEKYRKTSGVPKRAKSWSPRKSDAFILDASTFSSKGRGFNEFIVDNWTVTGVILSDITEAAISVSLNYEYKNVDWYDYQRNSSIAEEWKPLLKLVVDRKIPFIKRSQGQLVKRLLNAAP